MLPYLRHFFLQPNGPRARVVAKQNELFKSDMASPMLFDIRLAVAKGKLGAYPPTLPGGLLQPILMALSGRLFVPSPPKEGAKPVVHVLNDMFRQVARTREVHSTFYLVVVDCWPALQEEFVRSMAAFIKMQPENPRRMPFDCVAEIMKAIDPSLSRHRDNTINLDAVAGALCFTFHEKLKRHLRYHCATQLMMLLSNDSTINETNIIAATGVLEKTIPTLSGFADYLDKSFGFIIKQSIWNDSRNETICLFYESEWVPAWNMLPDGQGTKNLQAYLDGITIPVEAEELICAPTDLFKDKWPVLSEIGSLDTYIFEGGEKVMPPIRKVSMMVWRDRAHGCVGTVKLVAEIILPMRLLLTRTNANRTTWQPAFDFYTMNVTTDMLTQSICVGEMPAGFEVAASSGVVINASTALEPGRPLPADKFAALAEVMLTYTAAHEDFRLLHMENLPLLRNFVLVRKSIKTILPALHYNIYIDGNRDDHDPEYKHSPIQVDWGETSWMKVDEDENNSHWELILDEEFSAQFHCNQQPPARKSWTTSTFFDMSLSFLKEKHRLLEMDPTTIFTTSNIRETIWNARLEAEDITPLMKKMDLWSRHQFEACEMVVKKIVTEGAKTESATRCSAIEERIREMWKGSNSHFSRKRG